MVIPAPLGLGATAPPTVCLDVGVPAEIGRGPGQGPPAATAKLTHQLPQRRGRWLLGPDIQDRPCLHDMGWPVDAMRHARNAIARDGTIMLIEPYAGDRVEDNINPVGRLYSASSTMICVPTSLAQEVGLALGAQAGEARLREVITSGGFSSVRRATETPFNMILEARP